MTGSRREFLVAAGCGAAGLAGGLLSLTGRQAFDDRTKLAELIPTQLGRWRADPKANLVIPRGDEEEMQTYDQLLTRVYVGEAAPPMMLLIAYGSSQGGTNQLHRPENCYPAAGFDLQDRSTLALQQPRGGELQARTITATASGRIEQILYWSRIGRDFPLSTLGQRLALFRQRLEGTAPDGALVRISTIMPDYGAALPILVDFAKDLLDLAGPSSRLLTGR